MKYKNNDDIFKNNSSEIIVENYKKQAKTSEKAIRSIVETYLWDKDSIIIEWYQVTPELVFNIKKEFWEENIVEIFLVKNDMTLFLENINKTTLSNDWIIENTKNKETFLLIAEMIIFYSEYFIKESEKYNLKMINMNEKFESKIDYLCKSL